MYAMQLCGLDSFLCETLDLDSIAILLIIDRPFCQFALLDALLLSLLFPFENLIRTHQTLSEWRLVGKRGEYHTHLCCLVEYALRPSATSKAPRILAVPDSPETGHEKEVSGSALSLQQTQPCLTS